MTAADYKTVKNNPCHEGVKYELTIDNHTVHTQIIHVEHNSRWTEGIIEITTGVIPAHSSDFIETLENNADLNDDEELRNIKAQLKISYDHTGAYLQNTVTATIYRPETSHIDGHTRIKNTGETIEMTFTDTTTIDGTY